MEPVDDAHSSAVVPCWAVICFKTYLNNNVKVSQLALIRDRLRAGDNLFRSFVAFLQDQLIASVVSDLPGHQRQLENSESTRDERFVPNGLTPDTSFSCERRLAKTI